MSKKNAIHRGSKQRQLKTIFGDIQFSIPRLFCKACGKYFVLPTIHERLSDFEELAFSNITTRLRRIAILCGASWPYEQAANVIFELTGVEISHNQIKTLCESEALVVVAQQQQTYEAVENEALVETMNALDDYLSEESEKSTSVSGSSQEQTHFATPENNSSSEDRLYMGLDGVYIGEVRKKKHIEAKVGIVFTDDIANISKGRNLLLNKQYVGTFEQSDRFSQKLFCCATSMGVNEKAELIILGDGARWISRIAETQYPFATLILDWWHLKERVWETVDYLKQTHLSQTDALLWGRRLIRLLWRGNPQSVLNLILRLGESLDISFPTTARERRQLNERSLPNLYQYINNNLSSIVNYRDKKEAGYFISSVFAEKAIDILVCRRQKLRGMNWSREGAENVLIFRQLILNDQWQDYWEHKEAA